MQEMEVGSCSPGQKWETLSEKITKAQRARGVVQVIEHLPSKPDAAPQYCQRTTTSSVPQPQICSSLEVV
jgi:hypothetical protein